MENKDRLVSLDVLRGADMLFIMGFSGAVVAFCQLLGFGKDCWLATQMTHVAWHGFRHHDTIFPLFLFLAGVAWPFSMSGQISRGRTTGQIVRKVLLRIFMLWLIGLAMGPQLWKFDFSELRHCSVLAHIGVCWGVAALVALFVRNSWTRLAIAVMLLLVHFLALKFCIAPDAASLLASTDPALTRRVASYAAYGTDGFSFTGNIAVWIDRVVAPGRLYEVVFDPEGLLGKVSGTVTAMFGVFAGELLRRKELTDNRKTLLLVSFALVSLVACLAWMPWCPVNKKLWTSTFILAAATYSFAALALFYWIVDVMGWRRWAVFFRVIGVNSITIYVLMSFVGFYAMSKRFFAGIASCGNDHWSEMVFCLGQVLIEWLVLWCLHKKNTHLKV